MHIDDLNSIVKMSTHELIFTRSTTKLMSQNEVAPELVVYNTTDACEMSL